MALTVSRRPLTAEAQVRFQTSQRGICSGQSGSGTGFSPTDFRLSPVIMIPPTLHIHPFVTDAT
jgi:hypothetical protein